MTRDREQSVNSFAELKSVFEDLYLEIPKIDENLLQDPSKLDEVKQKRVEICRQIQSQVASVLKWRDEVALWLLNCNDRLERKNADSIIKDRQAKVEQFINERLADEDLIFRSVAAQTIFMHFFRKEVSSIEDRDEAAKGLEGYGLLVPNPNGAIRIGYPRFEISKDFGLDEEDRQEIGRCYEQFNRSLEQIERQRRQTNTEEMKAEANITLEQFREGLPGKLMLEVPPEQQSENHWLGGGNLLLENFLEDGESKVYVLPLMASGKIEGSINSMVSEGVKLLHETIFTTQPPGGPKLIRKIEVDHNLPNDEAYRHVGKMRSLWYMIQRALQQAKVKQGNRERALAKVDEMANAANITPEEFFGLATGNLKEGKAYLEFKGGFKSEGDTVYHLSFLIERSEADNRRTLTVLDSTEYHSSGILKPFMGQPQEEGDSQFNMLPTLLGRMLRAIRSQVDKASQLSQTTPV